MWIRVNSYNFKPEIHWSEMLKEITEKVSKLEKELAINLSVAAMNVQYGASSRVEQYGKESHEVNTADIYITLNRKDHSAITIVNETANIITKYFDLDHEKVKFKINIVGVCD
jgi:septum formation topological specificity factor MinE